MCKSPFFSIRNRQVAFFLFIRGGKLRGGNRFWKKSVIPLELPFPENLIFFWDSALSEGETAFGKNRLSPSDSPFPKIFAFIFLFCPLIQVYADNKVIDKDKNPYSKNAKRKSGYIKNINNEVLGKGERERDNRFYKIGFPPVSLSQKKNNTKKEREGEKRFYKVGFPFIVKYYLRKKLFLGKQIGFLIVK